MVSIYMRVYLIILFSNAGPCFTASNSSYRLVKKYNNLFNYYYKFKRNRVRLYNNRYKLSSASRKGLKTFIKSCSLYKSIVNIDNKYFYKESNMLASSLVRTQKEVEYEEANKSVHIHVNITGDDVTRMERLKGQVHGGSRKNVVLAGLQVLEAFIETEKDKSKNLYTRNSSGEYIRFDPYEDKKNK